MIRAAVVVLVSGLSFVTLRAEPQRGPKPGPAPTIPLSVTVEVTDAAGNACAICPDAADPYVNGQEGVDARLDHYGNLILDFGPRNVEFAFGNPDLPGGSYAGSYVATRALTGRLQDMAEGTSQCAEMNWVFRNGAREYRLLYQRSGYPGAIDVSNSAFAFVTRTDADTWTIEPRGVADCADGNDLEATVISVPTRGKVVYTDHGAEALPFRLTLARQ